MTPALLIVISDANFVAVKAADDALTPPLIQGIVSRNGFTHYITGNLTPPGGTVYIMRQNANGSFIANQSKQPAYVTVTDTFAGWPIPA